MPMIFLFSNFDHDYNRQTTTERVFFSRPVVEAFLRDGLITRMTIPFEDSNQISSLNHIQQIRMKGASFSIRYEKSV